MPGATGAVLAASVLNDSSFATRQPLASTDQGTVGCAHLACVFARQRLQNIVRRPRHGPLYAKGVKYRSPAVASPASAPWVTVITTTSCTPKRVREIPTDCRRLHSTIAPIPSLVRKDFEQRKRLLTSQPTSLSSANQCMRKQAQKQARFLQ
jgi:hypothetical protein